VLAAELVPGDVIMLEEGDTVPADARLVESTALQTAEAALTGESLPVSKDTRPIIGDVELGDRRNMVRSVVPLLGSMAEWWRKYGSDIRSAAKRREGEP